MSGQELVSLYIDLFNEEPMKLTTVDIENPVYKEMISYCNITGTPINDAIITKFFGGKYDLISGKDNNFNQFKKPN